MKKGDTLPKLTTKNLQGLDFSCYLINSKDWSPVSYKRLGTDPQSYFVW